MTKTIKTLQLILFLIVSQIALGQTNTEEALSKGREAIELMENGKFDESIKLLKEAQKLDPDRFDYPYEIAYAYYSKGDYKNAAKILEKIRTHKDVSDKLFQLLGNCYDILGKQEKAFEIYDQGLEIFPKSGNIYLEKGNIYWGRKDYNKALNCYEKGIEVDPTFPSNYYRASLLYCSSNQEVWGLLYGEIFMNLERKSKRTIEISKLLFNTYKREIKFTNDTSISVSFCQQTTFDENSIFDSMHLKIPFCMIFEPTFLISMNAEKSIDINSLDRIRSKFIDIYFESERDKTHPNALFSYQKKVKDAGHIEAYNHWILMIGDEDGFDKWLSTNKDKWDSFVKWFVENRLQLSDSHRFYSGQY